MGVNADAKAKLEARIRDRFGLFHPDWLSCVSRMELCLERGDSRAAFIALADFANRCMPGMVDRSDSVMDIPDQPQKMLAHLQAAGYRTIGSVIDATDSQLLHEVQELNELRLQKLRASLELLMLGRKSGELVL